MSITIKPEGDYLIVSGDMDKRLLIPVDGPRDAPEFGEGHRSMDCYHIAVSDGTLIRATHWEGDPGYEIEKEGAGLTTIDTSDRSLRLDWSVEWVAVASNRMGTAEKYEPVLKPAKRAEAPLLQ